MKRDKTNSQKRRKPSLFVLEGLTENPYQGDIEKVKGEDNVWRRRIGNYRIIYELKPKQRYIEIFQIERKTTTTYRKKGRH